MSSRKEKRFLSGSFLTKKGFEENFGVKLKKGKLAAEEKSLAKEIRENQFAAEQWNFKR